MRISAALIFVATMLSACSAQSASRAQTLVFTGLAGEPDSLNPLVSSFTDVYNFSHLYMSQLVESDNGGQLIPEVAVTVPAIANGGISSDGRTITYHLRRNMRWQDGVALTARDVIFSYHAVMNPVNNVATRVGYSEVDRISSPDAYTVVVHLRRPYSPIVATFFGPEGVPAIMPEHLLSKYTDLNHVAYDQRPMGSGPYRVVDWRRGDSVLLEANPWYWRGKPHIARMLFRIIPDPNTRTEQLQTGEVNAYFDVDPQLLPQVRSVSGTHVALTPVNDMHILRFNLTDRVLSDVRVRRSIALAIDRRKVIAAATHGAGIVVEGDQPITSWAYDSSTPSFAYDPAAARKLLDAAGWTVATSGKRQKGGQRLELELATSPQGINGSALVATMIQRYLADVGISVTIKTYPLAMLWGPKSVGGILANGRYQLAYDAWWTLGPDPDDTWNFACDQRPPAGQNYYFWCNRRADAAMHDALLTFDQARRKADYAIVQRELVRDLPEFTLWQVRMPNAYRNGLEGVNPSVAGSTFWNAQSWRLSRQ